MGPLLTAWSLFYRSWNITQDEKLLTLKHIASEWDTHLKSRHVPDFVDFQL